MSSPIHDAMRVHDRRKVPVTTTSADAVDALDDAIGSLVHHRSDTVSHLTRALSIDPELVPAHCISGFGAKLLGRADLSAAADAAAGRARSSLARRGGTVREEHMVRALERWCARDPEGAILELDAAQQAAPLDLLSMKLGHALAFLLGRTVAMRQSLELVLPVWERSHADGLDDGGLGPVLGCLAFAVHELGEADRAERIGRRAVLIDPRDPWAVHAVAHTLHSRGRAEQGLSWLDEQTLCLEGANNFGAHVQWHRALFLLALGRKDQALALHDSCVVDTPPGDYRDLVNSATLLFRLEQAGVAVGDRWERLATVAESRMGDHASAFADAHHVLALAAGGRHAEAERFLESMFESASSVDGVEAAISLEVALPVARAIASLRSNPALACDLLVRHAQDLERLGGSQAQREIFQLVLDDAKARRARASAAA